MYVPKHQREKGLENGKFNLMCMCVCARVLFFLFFLLHCIRKWNFSAQFYASQFSVSTQLGIALLCCLTMECEKFYIFFLFLSVARFGFRSDLRLDDDDEGKYSRKRLKIVTTFEQNMRFGFSTFMLMPPFIHHKSNLKNKYFFSSLLGKLVYFRRECLLLSFIQTKQTKNRK